MISKHKISFEGISDKVWENLDKKLQIDVSKYRRVRRDVIKFEKEIEKQRELIKELVKTGINVVGLNDCMT